MARLYLSLPAQKTPAFENVRKTWREGRGLAVYMHVRKKKILFCKPTLTLLYS